jgi:hypothetical protein
LLQPTKPKSNVFHNLNQKTRRSIQNLSCSCTANKNFSQIEKKEELEMLN